MIYGSSHGGEALSAGTNQRQNPKRPERRAAHITKQRKEESMLKPLHMIAIAARLAQVSN